MHALSPIRPLPSLLRVLYSPFMNCTGWTCMRYGERLDVGSWEMRDTLSRNNANLGIEQLPGYAREIGLDVDAFDSCLSGDRHQTQITQDSQEANRIRVTGTPSFVIGIAAPAECAMVYLATEFSTKAGQYCRKGESPGGSDAQNR